MRKLWAGLFFCAAVLGQTKDASPRTAVTLTVATLPGSPVIGILAWISDGATSSDCAAGGGGFVVQCRYSGSAWVSASSGTPLTCATGTLNSNNSVFNVGAATADYTAVTLPARAALTSLYFQTNTAFVGTGMTSLFASFGRQGTGNDQDYSGQYDLLAAVSDTNLHIDGGGTIRQKSSHVLNIRFTSGGAFLNALTAGQLEYTYCYIVRP